MVNTSFNTSPMNRGEDGIRRRRRNLQVLYLSGGQSCHLADGFDRQVQCLHPPGIRLLLFHAALGKTFLATLLTTFLAALGKTFLTALGRPS